MAYPGGWTYGGLVRLGKRDLEYWSRRALKVLIGRELQMVTASRMGMVTAESFRQYVAEMNFKLYSLRDSDDIDRERKKNWEDLAKAKRG